MDSEFFIRKNGDYEILKKILEELNDKLSALYNEETIDGYKVQIVDDETHYVCAVIVVSKLSFKPPFIFCSITPKKDGICIYDFAEKNNLTHVSEFW